MRGFAAFLCLFLLASTAAAGLYNTSEPDVEKRTDPGVDPRDWFQLVFRDTLAQLRSIGLREVPVDKPLRKRYVLAAELAARANTAKLTVEDKLNLSDVLVRRRKHYDAINLLLPLARQQPKHFLVQCNLATAYQLAGQESQAADVLAQAISVWPNEMRKVDEPFRKYLESIGWHDGAFALYRQAETFQLKLLRLRARENLAKKKAGGFETVDALFDDGKDPPNPIRFIGASGNYEAGAIAREEKAKLPKNAIDIVQQLLIWLPDDLRLYWLLGELYNAQGGAKNVAAALSIFNELAGFGGLDVRAKELAEHRHVLQAYQEKASEPTSSLDLNKRLDDDEKKRQDQPVRIDWQTLGVGFGIGLVVAIFGAWQIREIRRRFSKGSAR